jgi:hypothetical protein
MRYLFLLTTAVLLGQSSAVSAQAYGDPVAAVDSWYRAYLGRTSLNDPSSVGWVNLLRRGSSPQSVIAGILGSDEYFNRVGGTMPAFLQALSHEALGRPLSPSESNFWMQRAHTQTRQEIASEMLLQNPAGGIIVTPPAVVVPGRERERERAQERWRDQERYDYRRPYYPYRW